MLLLALFPKFNTVAQTAIKADIYPGAANSFPFDLTVYGNTLIFNARDSLSGYELWSLDTASNLTLRGDVFSGVKSSFPFDVILHNGNLYFSANDGANGHELWEFDGSTTTMAGNINPDSSSSWPDNFITYNGALFFTATDSLHGNELWKYDNTSLSLVSDLYPDTASSSPNDLSIYNGELYFSATDSAHGTELWKYNGTNVSLVSDINPGPGSSYPNGFMEYKGTLMFSADNGSSGFELWKYDGTTPAIVRDINTGTGNSFPHYFTEFMGDLYFSATDNTHGNEIWKYDGLTASFVSDVMGGSGGSYPADFTLFRDELYFSANDGVHGFELWKMDTTEATFLVADIVPNSESSFPVNLTEFHGELIFRASDTLHGAELWSFVPCVLPDTAVVSASDTLVCKATPVTINVDSTLQLNDASQWMLYKDSCGGQAIDSSVTGVFSVTPDTTAWYFIRGEGCSEPGVADSILIEVFAAYQDTITDAICEGSSYVFGSQVLSNTGIYSETFTATDGCDSIITLVLTVMNADVDTLQAQLCNGDSMVFNGQTLKLPGYYTATYQNINGCDSLEVLDLNLLPDYNQAMSATICAGESFQLGSQTLTAAGTYTELFQTAGGCDSLVTLNLGIAPAYQDTISDTICNGFNYVLGNQTLTTSGTYTETFQSINGCDSSVTIHLSVFNASQDTILATICDNESYAFEGQVYTTAGIYTATFPLGNQCDSTITLVLDVLPVYQQSVNASICTGDTYVFGTQLLTTSGNYTETFQAAGGCDSVVDLSLTVYPTFANTITDTICSGSSYVFGGQTLTTSGIYTETFQSVSGCDSVVTLALTIQHAVQDTIEAMICDGSTYNFDGQALTAAGVYTATYPLSANCDSTITLFLTVQPVFNTSLSAAICEGETYVFGSQTLTTGGNYTETFQSASGCDSVVDLTLTVGTVYRDTIQASICGNATYALGNQTLTASGTYTETFTSQNGCDSSVTVDLTVYPVYNKTISATICNGGAYFLKDQWFTSFGIYTKVFQTVHGCDSTVTLYLNVLPSYNKTTTASICSGESYTFNNQVYTTAGTYRDTLQAMNGCDSIIRLVLNVEPIYNHTVNVSICSNESYTFGGQLLTTQGAYTHTFQSVKGCDSTVVLNLSVYPSYNTTDAATICAGEVYAFGSQALTSAGTYTELFTAVNGCDSVVTLTLTVHPVYHDTFSATICNGEAYQLGTQSLTASGTYTEVFQSINGCDSIVDLVLTVNPVYAPVISAEICEGDNYVLGAQTLTASGTYTEVFQAMNGCDSTVTLHLTVHPVYNHSISADICDGQSYVLGTQTLSVSGSYTETFQSVNGCDSIVTVALTTHPIYDVRDTIIACDGAAYPFGTQTLTTSGNYTELFTTVNGCDSLVRLAFYVYPHYTDTLTATFCEGDTFSFGNMQITQHGTYIQVYQSRFGCDSVEVLNLTRYPSYDRHISKSMCGGNVYSFGGMILDSSGTYTANFPTVNGCDSVVTLSLNVNSIDNSVTRDGNHLTANYDGATYQWYRRENVFVPIAGATQQSLEAAINGIYRVRISDNFCSVYSDSISLRSVGIEMQTAEEDLSLYPNPNNGQFVIACPVCSHDAELYLQVFSASGEEVMTTVLTGKSGKYQVEAGELAKGIYFLNIQQNGEVLHKKFIVR